MRHRRGGWHDDFRARTAFEHRARRDYPGLHCHKLSGKPAEVVYTLAVEVPEYETRLVEIRFYNGGHPGEPRISADGPRESPHRYDTDNLCIWEQTDARENRWVHTDRLYALIEAIRIHLFREAWWREHGEWLGPEVIHLPGEGKGSR